MSQSKTPAIDLVAEARAIPRKPPGDPCCVVLATRQHPALAASVVALVHDATISTATASEVFARHNINIPALTIGRHRRTTCTHCTYHGLTRV